MQRRDERVCIGPRALRVHANIITHCSCGKEGQLMAGQAGNDLTQAWTAAQPQGKCMRRMAAVAPAASAARQPRRSLSWLQRTGCHPTCLQVGRVEGVLRVAWQSRAAHHMPPGAAKGQRSPACTATAEHMANMHTSCAYLSCPSRSPAVRDSLHRHPVGRPHACGLRPQQ